MIENLLPEMPEETKRVLEAFARAGSVEFLALQQMLELYLEHFRDIRNIDPSNRSVGLQVCSHLRAYDMLEEIFGSVALVKRSSGEKKSKSFR